MISNLSLWDEGPQKELSIVDHVNKNYEESFKQVETKVATIQKFKDLDNLSITKSLKHLHMTHLLLTHHYQILNLTIAFSITLHLSLHPYFMVSPTQIHSIGYEATWSTKGECLLKIQVFSIILQISSTSRFYIFRKHVKIRQGRL